MAINCLKLIRLNSICIIIEHMSGYKNCQSLVMDISFMGILFCSLNMIKLTFLLPILYIFSWQIINNQQLWGHFIHNCLISNNLLKLLSQQDCIQQLFRPCFVTVYAWMAYYKRHKNNWTNAPLFGFKIKVSKCQSVCIKCYF